MRWGRIDRDIEHHWAYEPHRSYTKREALIWLYLHCRYDDGYETLRGVKVWVKRGQMATSFRHLRKVWNWGSERRVIRFLEHLRDSGDLLLEKSPLGILVTMIRRAKPDTIEEVKERILSLGDANPFWTRTDGRQESEVRGTSDVTDEERTLLRVLWSIPEYPKDEDEDVRLIRDVREEFPGLDIRRVAEEFARMRRYSPMGKNPRLRFYNLCRAFVERGDRGAKHGGVDGANPADEGEGEDEWQDPGIAHLFR